MRCLADYHLFRALVLLIRDGDFGYRPIETKWRSSGENAECYDLLISIGGLSAFRESSTIVAILNS
jgi:hypothetical protein